MRVFFLLAVAVAVAHLGDGGGDEGGGGGGGGGGGQAAEREEAEGICSGSSVCVADVVGMSEWFCENHWWVGMYITCGLLFGVQFSEHVITYTHTHITHTSDTHTRARVSS